ncbi:nucleotidyltransferase family protein [Polynucleobacter paneuropaeus]|jgi:MurNAc alpha-1-phosphate uridylyltransferase|nr:nucleotidyltransferase family protein [Polynucleobacter paneuropaeus]MBT8571102.1 nucleotidyltransferase family protein [Polynucleobacter paneuropaeus]MBT8576507.1 nucleotidyltransferase family protein [Polynucleobacter paneuropaeus]MBT8582459.1 nucleotidyltransferase family protein [Polynucleobacter paneuropaeus]MBT8611654.1 nucleotidyltransferase family protein [Polynucleobacter paneuropaeus]
MSNSFSLPCLLLAAGRGERMRPLTDELPKPLLKIGNQSLLERHLISLSQASIKKVVINHAWLGEKIEDALGDGSQFNLQIDYSREGTALETAGGIHKALDLLKPTDYVLVINGDVFCPNFPIASLLEQIPKLRANPAKPLAYLVMVPNPTQHPNGDFYLLEGSVQDISSPKAEKLTFSGIGIYHQGLFAHLKSGASAKLAPLLKEAMYKKQVLGEKYLGPWHDVGTPQRLQELNVTYAST